VAAVQQEWEPEDLIAAWTLVGAEGQGPEEQERADGRFGATRLGFVLLLKFFEIEGRFPDTVGEFPPQAVDYVAAQVDADPQDLRGFALDGRTAKRARAAIRRKFGFRRFGESDEAKLAEWLAGELAGEDPGDERLVEVLRARCRREHLEPPARTGRIIGSARALLAERFTTAIVSRLSPATITGLEALVGIGADPAGNWLIELKTDPGRVGRDGAAEEIAKLARVRALGVPADLFEAWSPKLVATWRARATVDYPSDFREHPAATRLTLLAALAWSRQTELVDGLTDLLIALVHKIYSRAENAAEKELLADLRRVRGKDGLLYRLAEAALAQPEETVRVALYPVVGPDRLAELVAEGRASETALRIRTREKLCSSYSHHYRSVISRLLGTLDLRGANPAAAVVIEAVGLLNRHADSVRVRQFPAGTQVPIDGIVPAAWREAVTEQNLDESVRVERIPYEVCVLGALRDAIRRRGVWVAGSRRWGDPDADLPADFAEHREVHYARIRQPLDADAFITDLREKLTEALRELDDAVARDDTGGLRFATRRGNSWITMPKLQAQPEPENLDAVKAAVKSRWGRIELLDFLTEADHHVGLIECFPSVATREVTPDQLLRERLLLVLFALGTNVGISQVASERHPEAALKYVRRMYVTRANLRAATTKLVNATLAVRDPGLWGNGTACASDSKKFGSWSGNLLTEWHARYRGPGVMIYWHVETGRACIYSQLTSCSASEVAAMMTGLLHHGTDAPIEANYVDTHGASVIGFAFTHLLGYQLLPRLKNIGAARLYLPTADLAEQLPRLEPALTRAIRWDLIAAQYDPMIRYATALRLPTAEAEQLLRRFTRPGPAHPTHAALSELGRAVRTLFLARYLRSQALRRQVNDGLQVVENWNSANTALFYGKDADLTGPDRDCQETSVLALHLLQSALVHVNTLLVQRVLADRPIELTLADRRAITPLFWSHARRYGNFALDLNRHLDLRPEAA
jgi:TnpA family transposase